MVVMSCYLAGMMCCVDSLGLIRGKQQQSWARTMSMAPVSRSCDGGSAPPVTMRRTTRRLCTLWLGCCSAMNSTKHGTRPVLQAAQLLSPRSRILLGGTKCDSAHLLWAAFLCFQGEVGYRSAAGSV